MRVSEVSRLSDDALRRGLQELVAYDRLTTVRLLIHIAEFQSRGLYREAGYDSMFRYCVGELRMSEDVAYKRIRVAAWARRLPRILSAIAEGKLNVSAVAVLAPYLRQQNAEELLTEAEGKTRAQIEALLVSHFPQPNVPTTVRALPSLSAVPLTCDGRSPISNCQELAPGPIASIERSLPSWSEEKPLAPGRYVVRFTIDQEAHDLLERAKALLSHQIPSGDEGEVFAHALRALVQHLEKRKFGSTTRPRTSQPCEGQNSRSIPAHVKRAVSQRDGHQCTFVAQNGHRCEARSFLEFDHVLEVARGGRSTVGNLRLRCRSHNQLTADQTYGSAFMQAKREQAQESVAKQRAEEIIPWLQALGIRADHARQAASQCEDMPDASLQDRVKAALRCFAPRDVQLARATAVT